MNLDDTRTVSLLNKVKRYHFEWKHLLVLFIVLIFFQIIISFIHKISLTELQGETQDWYKRDSAERIANLTTTSLELLLETNRSIESNSSEKRRDMIQAFNIIFSQQLLQENIDQILVFVSEDDSVYVIRDGDVFYDFLFDEKKPKREPGSQNEMIKAYQGIRQQVKETEQIHTMEEGEHTYHVFVPLVPNGEFAGTVYLKISPDFSFINRQVVSNYDQTALIFSALILFGLLAMFYISSYTVKERDETQQQLFEERESHLREQIDYQKESLFTKRIYHTHHKAEKVMGFIKEDLRYLNSDNIERVKNDVAKYANFISRVIYDMKWYDPPLQTIRNPIFQTNINDVISFLIKNIFLRLSKNVDRISFEQNLQDQLPVVNINEYVVWEILEPLIQNSIDHSGDNQIHVIISTKLDEENNRIQISISDNGVGVTEELLFEDEEGRKTIFKENVSTKVDINSGYGCYLAYEVAKRCGWKLDVENNEKSGSCFKLIAPL
ncbi:MAG: ATP-binding protein [Calditrichaeota bacterium]|nr:MAG: ATP-binding protein [Calditrichota bacterium]MBL1205195.1 ATP-binding protein [Calditrichota bacterium]NOG45025.1 ATP-binding protein [Calditrichota bacterium]